MTPRLKYRYICCVCCKIRKWCCITYASQMHSIRTVKIADLLRSLLDWKYSRSAINISSLHDIYPGTWRTCYRSIIAVLRAIETDADWWFSFPGKHHCSGCCCTMTATDHKFLTTKYIAPHTGSFHLHYAGLIVLEGVMPPFTTLWKGWQCATDASCTSTPC